MFFFDELLALQKNTPRIGSIRLKNTNSEYTHNTDQCKNCYLLANAVGNEDCMYGRDFYGNANCVDCDHILKCTLCYECLNSKECWNCSYLQDCANCLDCDYGYYLKDCQNCIGCVGLRKKQYHIFNRPYSPEEYAKIKKSITRDQIASGFEELKLKVPRVFAIQLNVENCIGESILNSRNIYEGFDVNDCEDCTYVAETKDVKDSMDISVLEHGELCYECSSNHILYNSHFCSMCTSCSNLEYCEQMFNSKNCFGCIGLNHKEYCILNKQYTPEEYEKQVAEIKVRLKEEGTYGRFFLPSTYPLEDTVAGWRCL
ncbi:MAG: hypothetical protein WCT46_00545 [Candidatus Gracilibacteria bacterium]|jgi:hypothetical protein